MRTPEEIKKGLECCAKNKPYPCNGCPYERTFEEEWSCKLHSDALAYIKQLEEGIDRCYKLAKQLEVAPYRQATMKEVAEGLKRMGIDCCYEENEHD